MCKHVLNAQVVLDRDVYIIGVYTRPLLREVVRLRKVSRRAGQSSLEAFDCSCRVSYDRSKEKVFGCKKCKHVFRKNILYSILLLFTSRDFDETDEYCPNCDNHFVIDAETTKSKAINEGKAGVVVGVQGNSEREVMELREMMMKKMMEEGVDEDLLSDS